MRSPENTDTEPRAAHRYFGSSFRRRDQNPLRAPRSAKCGPTFLRERAHESFTVSFSRSLSTRKRISFDKMKYTTPQTPVDNYPPKAGFSEEYPLEVVFYEAGATASREAGTAGKRCDQNHGAPERVKNGAGRR